MPRKRVPGQGHGIDTRSLEAEAAGCTRCPLYRDATQTVFGEGPETAPLVFVGEQPGDKEDLEGRPFVGPAGGILARAFEEHAIPRERVYLTNAVKHFKFERRGKARIHKKPDRAEVEACRPWLFAELASVRPRLIVLLGATAAQALLGSSFRVTKYRGQVVSCEPYPLLLPTIHPSAVLRSDDRQAAYRSFAADLEPAARLWADPATSLPVDATLDLPRSLASVVPLFEQGGG